jgi:hypothetical protein
LRCYACDCWLESPPLDRQTGRYYCGTCLEPTTEAILALEGKERYYLEDNTVSLDVLEQDQEEPDDPEDECPWD